MTSNPPSQSHGKHDKHKCFADFAATRLEGWDYDIIEQKAASSVAVISIHGGIEKGTTELAKTVAGADYNLFAFHSYEDESRFFDVHITSNRYDEPRCVDIVRRSDVTVSIHGCRTEEPVAYVGGLDHALKQSIADEFNRRGVKALTEDHIYPADVPENICNRNKRGAGVQIELSAGLRASSTLMNECAEGIRTCLKKLTR